MERRTVEGQPALDAVRSDGANLVADGHVGVQIRVACARVAMLGTRR